MAITTLDGYIASAKQQITLHRTASVTAVALAPTSVFAAAGNPGAGSLAVGNTANGIVPTDATVGAALINAFGGAATGYVSRVSYTNTVASVIYLYDRVFSVGSITMTTGAVTTTLASQPSYSGRVPGGTDYTGLEIWLEAGVTALSNHAHTINVNYLDQGGVAGATGNQSSQNLITARMLRMPLAAGDSGVQQIVSVVANGVASSAGTFNIHVMRPLWLGRVNLANQGELNGLDRTGMPQVFADSSLYVVVTPDSTATGLPFMQVEIANG